MGINIKIIIAKALIKLNPVLNDNIHILLISNKYLQIYNFLYFVFSSFNCIVILLKILSNRFIYIFKKYRQIFKTYLSY